MNTAPSFIIKRKPAPHYWFLPGVKKPTVMKMSRMLHGYLSAFAFIALMFFALTGLLLNHPNWLKSKDGAAVEQAIILNDADLKLVLSASAPAQELGKILPKRVKIIGNYKSGEVLDDEIILRFSSAKGGSTVFADMLSGEVSIESKKPNVSSVIRELHRGKDTAGAWRFMIDVIATITLLLSSIGFFLFFTIRYRLMKSMALCGGSLAVFLVLYIWAIP